MIDDYQYTPTPLAQKNEGPFGLGGRPMEGSRGFSGSIVDSGPNFTIPPIDPFEFPSGLYGQPGQQGPPGPPGPTGPTGPLLGGSLGDMLYHNGATWVGFGKPNTGGILSMDSGIPSWITTNRNGSLLYYFADLQTWVPLPAPLGSETYVLGFKNNALEWMQTTDCDEPEEVGP